MQSLPPSFWATTSWFSGPSNLPREVDSEQVPDANSQPGAALPSSKKVSVGGTSVLSRFAMPSTQPLASTERKAEDEVVTMDDVGAISRHADALKSMLLLPLRHPNLFRHVGVKPHKGTFSLPPPSLTAKASSSLAPQAAESRSSSARLRMRPALSSSF